MSKYLDKPGKKLAVLLDPEKISITELINIVQIASTGGIDFFLVGGSLVSKSVSEIVEVIKYYTTLPVILFPGNTNQITPKADATFFLSLISGRNPEFLIGNHVVAAPIIKKMDLETIPVGYILVNCGQTTSVEYMSDTKPIPYSKIDIAVATAMAGEMLGLKAIYLEGGSGADKTVSPQMISEVRANTNIPLIVGGGIRNAQSLTEVYKAGADIAVIGTIIEEHPASLPQFVAAKLQFA
ncbi:MAG: geranylgeranylglyceryl/heptaprenylglyceryl phosphate synthase [Bacteroidales bacterium]|nr:geranylgeranylglyceryl/heptaprenylglyceryl phosphate synthase [Bacteroidales bacterium]